MDKKQSLILATIITLIILGNYTFFLDSNLVRENVEVSRILDGDTIELTDGRKVRLLNINAPEKGFTYSDLGKEFLSNFKNLELENEGLDKYGRTLARLYYKDRYLNLEIVKEGFAHSYLVDNSELKIFESAEKEAIKNEKNIWKKSEFYGCLNVEINKYEEYIDIEDECGVDFTSWTIKDESTKSYKFKSDIDGNFKLFSKKGVDKNNELYWGRENVWNNDHDEIFIRDSNGLLVYYYSYE